MISLCNERGSSLLEVIITLSFLGVACIPLLNLFHINEISVIATRQEIAALNRAQEIVEQVKALPDVYFGVVQNVAGDNVLLEEKTSVCHCQGLLILTGGQGSGQVRGIAGWEGNNVLLERPLDIPLKPEETTYLVLPSSDQAYPFTVSVLPGKEAGLRTVAVEVSYQERGTIRRVTLITEKLRR